MNSIFQIIRRWLNTHTMTLSVILALTSPAGATVPGDMNADLSVSSSDIIFLVNHVFKSGPAPVPGTVGDVDASCTVTASDIILLVNFVFKSGIAPTIGCPVEPALGIQGSDYANTNTGSDALVVIEKADNEDRISAYRILIVKNATAAFFNLDSATATLSSGYTDVLPTGQDIYLRMPSLANDTDGDPIAETNAYVAFVVSVAAPDAGQNALSSSSSAFTLANAAFVSTVALLDAATGGIEVDSAGFIYVADIGAAPTRLGMKVLKVHPLSGEVSIYAQGAPLLGASGNAFDSKGNLFQSNYTGGTISIIDSTGLVTPFASAGIAGPVGLVMDDFDTVYCADCNAANIKKISPSGVITTIAVSGLFNCPNGLTRDPAGNLYAANFSGGMILKITPAGVVSPFATLPSGNNGHAFYRDGGFWVVDRGGHRAYTIDSLGSVTLIAGTGLRGHADGALLSATFSMPNDVFLSPTGDRLYLNEVELTTGTLNYPSRLRVIVFAR
jgi:sugar lactone lactonase YvrE